MKKVLKDNLARIIKRLTNERVINKTEVSGDYYIIKENFKDLKNYMQNTFGLDVVSSNKGFSLRKYLYQNPVGINNKNDKRLYVLFALTLSELSGMTTDQNFIWNAFFTEVSNIYESEYNDMLTTSRRHIYSKNILNYLMEEEYLVQIELNEDKDEVKSLYSLKDELDKIFYERIDLNKYMNLNNDIRDDVRLVCQKLLLNGCIDKSRDEVEYNLMNNKRIKERVSDAFVELASGDGPSFELLEWDNYYLLLQIGGLGFPNVNKNLDMLAVELLFLFQKNKFYTLREILELAKTTAAYRNRNGIKNNLKASVEESMDKLVNFNFITKQVDEYYINGISTNISVEYI